MRLRLRGSGDRARSAAPLAFAGTLLLLVTALSGCGQEKAGDAGSTGAQQDGTTVARKFLTVNDTPGAGLEGPCFDRSNRYLFVTEGNRVVRIEVATKKVSTFYTAEKGTVLNDCAIHADGRLFVGDLGVGGAGRILAIAADGSSARPVLTSFHGKHIHPNGMEFDRDGNLYWNDFKGNAVDKSGSVMRTTADLTSTKKIVDGLAWPNGISLTPDGTRLWVSEMLENRLLQIDLTPDGTAVQTNGAIGGGVRVVTRFSGGLGPDSLKVDADGNVYQALCGTGRVRIIDSAGNRVKDVVVPGLREGRALDRQGVVIMPGTRRAFMVGSGTDGATVQEFKALDTDRWRFSHL
ncbi:SMP-30/gluconolactonase/LRE family protein [Streptomyces sp. WG-D5]